MSGNVEEWCNDWYGNYSSSPSNNPTGSGSGTYRVGRGGCWLNSDWDCRSSYRDRNTPDDRYNDLGLRLCLSE